MPSSLGIGPRDQKGPCPRLRGLLEKVMPVIRFRDSDIVSIKITHPVITEEAKLWFEAAMVEATHARCN
jgi:hypothetical protein